MAYIKLNEVDSTTGVGSILVVENDVIKQITDTDMNNHYGIDALHKGVNILKSVSSANSKRILSLEQRLSTDQFYTDDIVAYFKDVPENVCPYAEVSKVGGMTRKCTNLFPFPYVGGESKVSNGITFTRLADGGIHINGTNTHTTYVEYPIITTNSLTINATQLTMTVYGPVTDTIYCTIGSGGFDFGEVKSGTSTVLNSNGTSNVFNYGLVRVKAGATVSNVTIYPMLNSGSTALLYEPYFEGLRSAPVTEVESVGANLLPFPYVEDTKTHNGVTFTVNGDGTVTASGTAVDYNATLRLANNISLPAGTYRVTCTDTPKSGIVFVVMKNGVWHSETTNTMELLVESGDVLTLYLQVVAGVSVSNFTFKPMLNEGNTALPYTPYTKNTLAILAIPETVRALDGYGWGVNESIFNYIDWEKKQFVKRVGKIVLDGSADESWDTYTNSDSIRGEGYCYKVIVNDRNRGSNTSIANRFNNVSYAWDVGKIGDYGDGASDTNLYFISDISTLSEFKASLASDPIEVIYELAEPIVTDISDILPDDNFIYVESGGKLTFVNEHEFAVPSTVTYMSKEVSA